MKKIFISLVASNAILFTSLNADFIETTKVYTNKIMFWKSQNLENIDYETLYPKSFYEKTYFGLAITGAAIGAAGAFSYFTAGAGAPVAATGVSTVASWVAGGGAGSYMAGLSTIGGYFGGNAILGASILNGIALGTIGGGGAFTSLSLLAKVGVLTTVSASALDGVFYLSNPTTKKVEYKIKVSIPKNIGSKKTRELVDKIYEINDKFNNAVEKKEILTQKHYAILKEENNRYALDLLEYYLKNDKYNQEDYLVLGIIAWNSGKYKMFNKALSKIKKDNLENSSFYNYLRALSSLVNGEIKEAKIHLQNSIDENEYAIEPVILYINILSNENFLKNESIILEYVNKIEKNFDQDNYATEYSLVSVYYRLATIYFNNKRYPKATEYFRKAYDDLNIIQTYFSDSLKNLIKLGIANSLYLDGKVESSKKEYNDILSDIDEDNESELNMIKFQYLGTEK